MFLHHPPAFPDSHIKELDYNGLNLTQNGKIMNTDEKTIKISMTNSEFRHLAEYVKRVIGDGVVENETDLESLRQLQIDLNFNGYGRE